MFLPIVLVLTTIGSFSVGGGINDLFLMLGVGLVAYAMGRMHYPIAPLVIGVILGGLFDETFRRSLLLSDGDLGVFVTRPRCRDFAVPQRGVDRFASARVSPPVSRPAGPAVNHEAMTMYAVCVTFDVHPNVFDAFLERVCRQARDSLAKEPGCHRFDVWTDPVRPASVYLYEIYNNAEAFGAHLATDHFRAFDAETKDMVAAKSVETWSGLNTASV